MLPSAEDEVNVACFHPSPGGGLAYGTKVHFLLILGQKPLFLFTFNSFRFNSTKAQDKN